MPVYKSACAYSIRASTGKQLPKPLAMSYNEGQAGMAESADARDLKSRVGDGVRVQVPLPAPAASGRFQIRKLLMWFANFFIPENKQAAALKTRASLFRMHFIFARASGGDLFFQPMHCFPECKKTGGSRSAGFLRGEKEKRRLVQQSSA